jgi:hypothetical protein
MALTRPNVIVFQEYREFTVTPDIADLNVLVVGPCKQILDYLDDKTDCAASSYYGSAADANNPITTAAALTITTPPNIDAGAILEDDSVTVFFDDYRVIMAEVISGSDTDNLATHWANDNLFRPAVQSSSVTTMQERGVQAGDTLIVKTAGASDLVKTVKELVFVLYSAAGPNFSTMGTVGAQAGDIITITGDVAASPRNGTYVIKKKYVESGSAIAQRIEVESTGTSNWVGDSADATVTVTTPSGTVLYGPTSVTGLCDECYLRTTEDFTAANNGTAGNRLWRIERQLNDYEVPAASVSVDAETKVITIATNLSAPVTVAGSSVSKRISHANVYVQYMALRQDLQYVVDIETQSDLTTYLGKYDARNPLHVGVSLAKANTTTKVRAYGLMSDDLAGYQDFLDTISADKDIYSLVPLTYNTTILGLLEVMATNYADPNYCLDNGAKQKFRHIAGAVELVTQVDVVAAIGGGTTSTQVSSAPAGLHTLTLTKDSGQTADFTTSTLPGDTVTVVHVGGTATYTVANVNSALVLEVEETLTTLTLDASSTFDVKSPAGVSRLVTHPITNPGTGTTFSLANSALDDLYTIITVSTADFSEVIPGDIIQIPTDPETNTWTTYDSWVVALVESTTRLRVVNEGTDTSTLANELPHLTKRTVHTDRTVTAGSVYMKVVRNMTKSEQVTNLLSVAQGYASKRILLTYPSSVDVDGLTDGSLTRTTSTVPATADHQPGYYLSCCVGGQTAGQPSQQGFTNFPINGISRVYGSSDYFTEEQLTDLSNGGVYVFVQDTASGLPYTIHEVTTDVVSLETGEYMAVKNLDFISMTYLDTLRPFIGTWNINDHTIRTIKSSCESVGSTLRSRYVPKIGAPLISSTVDSVEQSDISDDRIEAYISVVQPMTLNVIGLHLVA